MWLILDFLYDNFFENYLLRNGTDAEKIVLYLTPFVLKINLKVIIYEFDNNSLVLSKDFDSNLEDRQTITLLFRKTHYDLVYSDKYFEKYAKELCYYVNIEESLKVVKNYELESKRNIKNNMEKLMNPEISKDIQDNEFKTQFPKCLECYNEYIHRQNFFGICMNCLISELYNQVMAYYLYYISEVLSRLDELNDNHIARLFHSCKSYINIDFYNIQINFRSFDMPIINLAKIAEKDINAVIRETKFKICGLCTQTLEIPYMTSPCGCSLCCKECWYEYIDIVVRKRKKEKCQI